MSAVLCLDLGTSLIKSVVFDDAGALLAEARRPSPLLTPRPGWVQQDMSGVLDAALETMTEAASASPEPVATVAITAQGDGFWPVDPAGRPAGEAILWNDGRAERIIDEWQRDGVLDQAFRINGSLGNRGLPHAIMRHQLDEGPGLDGVDAALTCGSWIFLALTGARGLHLSEASAPWLDVHARAESGELLSLYGLDAQADLVPPVFAPDELAQPLRPEIAERAGLPAGIPVVLAPYDVPATAWGGGSVAVGDAFCILGTTLCCGVVQPEVDTGGTPSGLTLLPEAAGRPIRAFPTLAGTGVIEWSVRMLGLDGPAELVDLAATSPDGAKGLMMWPYLSPAGERAPFLDGDARGVIADLDFDHTRADIARACLEGLAYVIRECALAAGDATTLALSGGGAASDLWCRIIADVTGATVVRSADSQIGAKGAMIAAGVTTGRYPDVASAAADLVRSAATFEPDDATSARYRERYEVFVSTRAALAGEWRGWSRLR